MSEEYDILTEEDKIMQANLPDCVFEFMGIEKPLRTDVYDSRTNKWTRIQ